MIILFKNKTLPIRRFWQTIIFYTITISAAFIIGYFFPMGPCADFLSAIPAFIILGVAIISLFFIAKTVILVIKKDTRYLLSLTVHIAFWIFIAILFYLYRNAE